jgi:hypothetical protein
MKGFCSLLIVLAIIVGGVGYYRGWFTVSGGREADGNQLDVSVKLNRDKVQADVDAIDAGALELGRDAQKSVKQFGNRPDTNTETRPK